MNAILNLGKYLFPIPFLVFGIMHFTNADGMAGMAPFGGKVMIYITGLAMILAAVSMYLGKYDKLACILLAFLMLLYILLIHLKAVSGAADAGAASMSMIALLKDLGLMGGALLYGGAYSRDNSIVG